MAQEPQEYVIGVDLGGTRLRAALANRQGEIVRSHTVHTLAEEGRDAVIGRIVAQIRAVLDPLPLSALRGVAVAVPGPVDPRAGYVYRPPNLPGWGDVPLKQILQFQLNAPVALGNDANLAALAEHRFGAGRGYAHMIYMTVSTGIGGGIVEDNRLVLGGWGGAGEVGHQTIDLNGPRCSCGNFGCLEAMASGTAIGHEAERRLLNGEASVLRQEVDGKLAPVNAEQVVAAARGGDELAHAVIDWAGYNLGVGIANLLQLFDPQAVVIGGGVSN
ncbi:MAG TPA: ROK family protein, partial [Chloroflexota bacterium]|nr:ROK family protein [Chloroflexota bacterium]